MNDVTKLLEQRDQLIKEMSNIFPWVNGSVVESVRKHKNKETPFYYLSQSIKGQNKITYISARDLEVFKSAAKKGLQLKKVLSELSILNIKLIKAGYVNDKH
jgi:flagellar hook-associated protein FlgK